MSAKTIPAAPYAGLRPYSEDDAPFFFGRERVAQILTDNLRAKRLTLVYGASGVGKSSVLRAGVQHQLHRLAQENLELKGTPQFAVAVFQEWREWKDDPVSGLRACVRNSVRRALGDAAVEIAPSSNLAEGFQALARRVGGDLLIILDQFEDYFLISGQANGEGTFPYEFQRLINRPDLRVNFLLSIREDAYSKLECFKDDISGIYDNSLQIDHLDTEAAREAITGPIDQYNRFYAAGNEQIAIEPALVEEVLIQVRTGNLSMADATHSAITEKSGGSETEATIETPFLQLVMTELWKAEMRQGSTTLRRQTLEDLHGAQRIVETHLRLALEKLSESEKALAASAFGDLVTPSGDKRAYTAFDIAEAAELNKERLTALLEKLSRGNNRILRSFASPDRKGESSYEIFHDVLAEPILDWRRQYRQNQRIKEEKRKADEELAETKRRAEEEKKLAEASARADEQAKVAAVLRRKNRALALAASAAMVFGIAAVGFAILWLGLYQKAENGRHQAVVAGNVHSDVLAELYSVLLYPNNAATAGPYLEETLKVLNQQIYKSDRVPIGQGLTLDNITEIYQKLATQNLEETLKTLNKQREVYRVDRIPIGEGITLNNIAGLYHLIGQSYAGNQKYEMAQSYDKQSEEKYREALALLQDVHVLGRDHPDVATSLNDLAMLYSDQGKDTEAEPLFERALAILENNLGRYDRFVADAVVNLANCYYIQGKYDAAEFLYSRALKIRKKELRADHPELAESLNHLAWLYVKRGKFARAEPLFKDALAIWQGAPESERLDAALSLYGLAAIYRERENYPEAAKYLTQAAEAQKTLFGPDHPENTLLYADGAEQLALFYDAQNDLKAESSFLEARKIRKNGLGDKHPDTAYTEGKLAAFYYKHGKYTEAEQYFNSAVEIQKACQILPTLRKLYSVSGDYTQTRVSTLRPIRSSSRRWQSRRRRYPGIPISLTPWTRTPSCLVRPIGRPLPMKCGTARSGSAKSTVTRILLADRR